MSTDYAKLGAKTKFMQNVEENRRLAQAYPGLQDEVQHEISSQRMATARAARGTTTTKTNGATTNGTTRRGRKPGSKNKSTTANDTAPSPRNSVDELSGIKD